MGKRLFDLSFALIALLLTLPIIALFAFLIWAQDGHSPFYRGLRVGRGGRDFRMIKLRTMVAGGDRLGGSSTSAADWRVTRVGSALRRLKLDELPQFWNVLLADMSVVGPRPNLRRGGVDRYTAEEQRLLSIRPGITDMASIVFADEGEILKGSADPDAAYDRQIRPWKNRLALLYVDRHGFAADIVLIGLTIVALISRRWALRGVSVMLQRWDADPKLRRICSRVAPLPMGEPPGQMVRLS